MGSFASLHQKAANIYAEVQRKWLHTAENNTCGRNMHPKVAQPIPQDEL